MSKTFLTEHLIGHFDFHSIEGKKAKSEFHLEIRIYGSKKQVGFFKDDHGHALVEEIYEFPRQLMFKVKYTEGKFFNTEIVFLLSRNQQTEEYKGDWMTIRSTKGHVRRAGKASCKLKQDI